MVDELVRRFLVDFPEKHVGIISVDPSKRRTGGALLGDRIRMNSIHSQRVYMRSLAPRQTKLALSDLSLYVMTPEYGAATQLEKIDMLDFADVVAINKFDKRGALDALRDVKKQYIRNHGLWEVPMDDLPIFGTIASQFNDPGMNRLYKTLM